MMYLQQTLIGHEEADLRGQNLPELPQQPSSRLLQQQLLLKPLLGLQRDYQEKKKKKLEKHYMLSSNATLIINTIITAFTD